LTPLRDDPAGAWLGSSFSWSIALVGHIYWTAYLTMLSMTMTILVLALGFYGYLIRRVIYFFTAVFGVSLVPAMRRAVVRARNRRLQTLVRRTAQDEAAQIDDWSALEAEGDGRVVSLVGWVRGHAHLATPIGRQPCVGVALSCQQNYPGVMESLHDFDLIDEQGRALPIQVAGGRLIAEPNVRVFSDQEGRALVMSLDLPPGAVSTGDAFALRDGDPVMVIGFKTTVVDPSSPGTRQAPMRTVIASGSSRPLLVYAINAERRQVPAALGG
jgi:hypothetical protein